MTIDATMNFPLTLDATPLPTDWENIHELFADMRKFAEENPRHTFLSADDPGHGFRVPRLGWTAFFDGPGDEREKMWTISVVNMKRTFNPSSRYDLIAHEQPPQELAKLLQTQTGRQRLIEHVIGRPAVP